MQLLTVTNLHKRFNLEAGIFAPLGRYVHAVNGVSFCINRNETYGLVGEYGCGKTTTARLLVRMYEADEGEILFHSHDRIVQNFIQDVRRLKGRDFKRYRERVKYVFQDPARSLNPGMTIYETLTSGTRWSTEKRYTQKRLSASLREEAAAILEEVGLSAADLERRPAEFSDGQRLRISIARGLMMNPDVLICDEVITALDTSIQGQILNLLLDLRNSRQSSGDEISFLFITHDLKTASYFCDRIGIMYRGEIMEEAPAAVLWKSRLHPYTELLFSSAQYSGREEVIPRPEVKNAGPELPRLTDGCVFASRCPHAGDVCFREKPPLTEAEEGHSVRCWRS